MAEADVAAGNLIIAAETLGAFFSRVERSVYTASTTWNKPAGAQYVRIQVVGGGGGGGGANTTAAGEWSFGDGGGGGEYAETLVAASALGASETVTVGAAGSAGSGVAGGTGGTSSLGTVVTAVGGGGGSTRPATSTVTSNYSSNTQTRAGGSGGSGGDIRIPGSVGGKGMAIGSTSGQVRAGDGGASALGAARVENLNGNGNAGHPYGSGGSGAANAASQAARSGGAGGVGVVIVTTYI